MGHDIADTIEVDRLQINNHRQRTRYEIFKVEDGSGTITWMGYCNGVDVLLNGD